jgi:hypothetical protein
MAEIEFSQKHYETTCPQDTIRDLPISGTQNGSPSSHQVPSSRNRVSSEDRSTLGKVNVTDRNDGNQRGLEREEEELQPLKAEEEQVHYLTAILAEHKENFLFGFKSRGPGSIPGATDFF